MGYCADHLPRRLSGGERRRIAVARALAVNPKLLIADDPAGNLDSANAQEILDLFKELNKEEDLTVIMATHNQKLGVQAKRIVYLRDGKIVSQ